MTLARHTASAAAFAAALLSTACSSGFGGASIVGTWECGADALITQSLSYWDPEEKDLEVRETDDGYELASWSECKNGDAFPAEGDGTYVGVMGVDCEGYSDSWMYVDVLLLELDGEDDALWSGSFYMDSPYGDGDAVWEEGPCSRIN